MLKSSFFIKSVKMKHWIKSLRIPTLIIAISSVLIGNSYAGLKIDNISITIFILSFLIAIILQIIANFANDYGDFINKTDNKDRTGDIRALQTGDISLQQMKNAIIFMSVLAVFVGLILIYVAFDKDFIKILLFVLLGFISILAALRYTLFNKPYGYRGLGDLAVFIFFGNLAIIGSFYLQTLIVDWLIFLPAWGFGAIAVSILNINNIRDYNQDKKANKKTLVVIYGIDFAKKYQLFLNIIAVLLFALSVVFIKDLLNMFIIIAIGYIFFIKPAIKLYKSQWIFLYNDYLKKQLFYLAIFSIFYSFII
ncbi:MAG: 1,4-dihydroxy-2-naphthoate octaprenyltransferase [Gammaproteobacteria bacterium]|nr:MAG: 1,4-dihydroxy-2-naphthoate octaprenyltransferase [Gammaproteobacteria bacterium]